MDVVQRVLVVYKKGKCKMVIDHYLPIIGLFGIALILALIMYGVSYIVVLQLGDSEKVSPYECGFNPFEDARQKFQVKFYLVAILFLIFDLEVSFLFPWSITLNKQGLLGYWTMFIFLLILTIGFVYEWKKGALEWE